MTFRLLPITPRHLARTTLGSLLVAIVFCFLLGRYWSFYHLGVGGGTAVLLGLSSLFGLAWVRIPGRRGVLLAVTLPATVAALVLTAEISRTRAARSGEGPGAGDLAPFFRSLVGLR